MRNSKDRWEFEEGLPSRLPLKAAEVNYWKNILKKILKVGMEFEFNLPEKKNGSCKGDSNTCPCTNLTHDNDCWKECVNSQVDCSMVKTCSGILCPNFVPYCFICDEFQVSCEDCRYKFDPNKNPDAIRKHLADVLRPNNSYGQVSSSGVHSITKDGSLQGQKGAEVITVGRRVDYWEFYKMAKNIIEAASSKGAYLNERCSTHMHVLAGYHGKTMPDQERMSVPARVDEMERPIPELVVANLHQLVRRYQNAMTWMTMGLDEPHRMTRWEKFRVSVLDVSALTKHMNDVRQEVSEKAGGNKYGWINYNHLGFSPNGDINRLHVEFRAADGMLSPSAIAAIGCMYYALIIKAVEISRYGFVGVGDKAWLEQSLEVKAALLNNMKNYQDGDRFGDTRNLHKYYEILIGESMDLVQQLKAILINIGPAYEVLEKLAERPIALRRCDGESWERIEHDLEVIVGEEGQLEIAISEIIALNQVSECRDIEEWSNAVGQILKQKPELGIDDDNAVLETTITEYVRKNQEDGLMVWSNRIGAPLKI